ncbi:DUF4396 domain-containing protein [Modicisalibacter xianhensis]|uniref:DUF4396 domain-containing protein n=1 Tax=Modicisalibacter xianhensis TaxID=442341 RepID=A0A1I3AW57_9GAMM|nr:DUF4396 domain-containing protein [Halomonas xianhensis]SFH54253.1 protein of unknown function [Halomonas xianhensis]
MIPTWLHVLAWISVLLGIACAAYIALDVRKHPQHMSIMNYVWPLCALFGHVVIVPFYLKYGRLAAHEVAHPAMQNDETPPHKAQTPFPLKVAKGALHCGSGCTLGDIIAETLAFLIPAIAIWFGWQAIFGEKIFAVWVFDYTLAFLFGVAFQYFTIKPMRGLSPGQGLVQATKADFLSLTAWQVGMYGFMAFAHFYLFAVVLNHKLHVNSAEFWFMMQIAMFFGFMTSYPINWWLIKKGIKEAM